MMLLFLVWLCWHLEGDVVAGRPLGARCWPRSTRSVASTRSGFGTTLDRVDRGAGRGVTPRRVQGPSGLCSSVALPPLPGRRLAAGGRRDRGGKGVDAGVVAHPQLSGR